MEHLLSEKTVQLNISAFNTVIYGHHMNNGTMFSDLIKYKDKTFL